MEKLLDHWEKRIMIITLNTATRNGGFLFVLSVYGTQGREALVVLANLIQIMSEKWTNPFCKCMVGLMVRL